jgi:small subunit ribosomal protein S8
MMTDPIADMLTRLRNASLVHKKEVVMPFSKIKMAIATILVREGYVAAAETTKEERPMILIKLKYHGRESALQHLKRISTPGARRYVGSDGLGHVLNGLGIQILSTPRGILTNREAKQQNVGGEVLCEIY